MPVLQWGQYAPDISDLDATVTATMLNVVPRADGVGPFQDYSVLTASLPAPCRGLFFARATTGDIVIYAGTATQLYRLDNTNFTWVNVSKATYGALGANEQWQFAQFNNYVFAVAPTTTPQYCMINSAAAFADLKDLVPSGLVPGVLDPPTARYIAIVGRFVVLSGLVAAPFRIQWCALNDPTKWDPAVNQSDFQDLPDGGIVRGVAGGEFGVIFQDASIRRMTYAPGSPVIFQIDRISQDDGIFAPFSLVRAGDRVFFCSPQGFKQLPAGGYPTPIGKERVDRTFFRDVDTSSLHLMLGAADPRSSRVFWSYKSTAGASGLFDKILVYDWALDRWARLSVVGEYLSSLSRPGLTLEGLDSISSSLDALPIGSLDDVAASPFSQLAGVDTLNRVGFFTGANLEATVETAEQNGGGRRLFVRGFRPLTDAAGCFGSVSRRETAQGSAIYMAEQRINRVGMIPARVSTRYARARLRIPAGTQWTFAKGVEPDAVPEGAN